MGLSPVPTPAVLDALRTATLSDDGLTLTLNGQLDADTYRRVKKALDVYGGKWNRKAGTHDFTKDFRPHLEHLLGGGKIGADNGGKNPLAYFPTPYPVIEEMCKRIWPWAPGARFLEPSAGSGPIAQFLRDRHQTAADCLELDEDRHDHLTFHGFNVVGRDFLQFTPDAPYDYVLMNPPFTAPGDALAYITHIEHALRCLKPGGDLVAIVPQGYAYVTQKRVTAFREFCEKHAQSPMHTFPPGTFKGSGTDVTTCLIHITKPEAESVPAVELRVGQRVVIDHPALGVVTEEITEIKPGPRDYPHPHHQVVFFMHEGREWGAFSSRVQPIQESAMTQPSEQPAAKKTARKSKKAAAPADTQVDFKQLAAETRKKMQAGAGKGKAAAATSTEVSTEAPTEPVATIFQPGHIVSVDLMTRRMNGVVLGGDDEAGYRVVTKTAESLQPSLALIASYVQPATPLKVGDEAWYTGQDGTVPNVGLVIVEGTDQHVMARDRWDEKAGTLPVSRGELLVMRRLDVADALADLGISQPGTAPAPADDLPFPVTEAELDAAVGAEPDYEALFPVGSRVTVDDGATGTVHSHYHDPLVEAEEGVRADGCLVAPDGWDGTPEALHDVAHVQLSAAPELPGTPVLISPADLKPGILGLHAVPLHQTARSSCNVRHHYDPAAIEELAASLKAEGQIENATGRWNADGQVEIVAGESRRRAQLWREEQGEQGLTLLVNVRELTDAEALSISATENMRRRNMTALEECEAMHRLNQAGRSVEEIATMFGYKSLQPVADRILVATNLHTTPRDLLDKGELSLAQAMVIARAPGAQMQVSMTDSATSRWHPSSAKSLAEMLTRGQFLVKDAKFKVEASGLEVKRDLFDTFEPFFEDKAKALAAQIQWTEAKAEKLRAKGKHAFVHVITDGTFERYGRSPYTSYGTQGTAGLVLTVNPNSGAYKEENDVYLRENTSSDGNSAKKEREISDSAYQQAHELRAAALRESVLGNTHLTLAMTVWGLILGATSGEGRVKFGELSGLPKKEDRPAVMPMLHARAVWLGQVLRPTVLTRGMAHHPVLTGYTPDPTALLELLIGMTDEELLGHLNTLVSVTAYDWGNYNNKTAPRKEYALLASLTDAPQRLARSFKLTDEWLKKYPRPDLVALAEEAGLGRALVEDCGTLKEMRARILEHADALHRAGFVPKLVQFPEAPQPTLQVAAAASQDPAEPERERALAALAQIPDTHLNHLLDASGYDHTDWDTNAERREWLTGQINCVGEEACAEWTLLHEMAADAASHGTFVVDLSRRPAQAPQEATPATPAVEGDREALEARAKAIIATLNRAQADAVLLAWGWDCTDWDSLEQIKRELPGELIDMTLTDLRGNAELWALEPQVPTAAETAAD